MAHMLAAAPLSSNTHSPVLRVNKRASVHTCFHGTPVVPTGVHSRAAATPQAVAKLATAAASDRPRPTFAKSSQAKAVALTAAIST